MWIWFLNFINMAENLEEIVLDPTKLSKSHWNSSPPPFQFHLKICWMNKVLLILFNINPWAHVFSVSFYHPVWQNSMHKAPVFHDEGWWLSEGMAREWLFKPWTKLATLYGLPYSFERTNGGQTIVISTWALSRLYSPEMNKAHLVNNWYFSSDKKWAF